MRSSLMFALSLMIVGLVTMSAGPDALAKKASSQTSSKKDAPLPSDITAAGLQKELANGRKLFLLDVRSSSEFASGHLKGAVNIPVFFLKDRLTEIPKDQDVVAICQSGGRSARAAEILRSSGYTRVTNFADGMMSWTGPVER